MKKINNTQPSTAEPSQKKKRRRCSTHYIHMKGTSVRTQKIQSRNAPIEGRGTPKDLIQSNKILNPKILWRLDCEIWPVILSPIVEEADGNKARTISKLEELKNDSIQEDYCEETNSTSVLLILWVFHIFSCLST